MAKQKRKKEKLILVADCETNPFEYGATIAPFVWGLYGDGLYETFDTTAAFIDFIADIDCICYAHNGGKFDWHFILDYIADGTPLLIINGRLSRFKIGKCEFRDSWNILPVALSKMEKESVDYEIFRPIIRDKPENRKIILDYLYSDCANLYRFVMAFIDRHGLCITQASAAMKLWAKIAPDKVPQDTGYIFDTFSPYYYGGRCECFESGIIAGELVMVDINSAYPFAMLSEHPISCSFSDASGGEVIGSDFLTVTGAARGCFPVRKESGGLFFPADNEAREYKITGWEYIAAREAGFAFEIKEHWRFDTLTDFKEYILPLYTERKEAKAHGDKARDLLAKLAMNSLYGKFGSNPENYECFRARDNVADIDGERWHFAGYLGDMALESSPLPDSAQRFYNVATAASITGFVRAMLWRAIRSSAGVVYCDTDSLVCRAYGDGVTIGGELGEWSKDYDLDGGGVGGKKLYAFKIAGKSGEKEEHYKKASKGARLSAKEILSVCGGLVTTYKPFAPTFSVRKPPVYTERVIKMTK